MYVIQVSSNITEVDHHITKYRQCVENLKERIAELESQREMEWRKGEGEGEALCAELKALLHKEKDIRYVRGFDCTLSSLLISACV